MRGSRVIRCTTGAVAALALAAGAARGAAAQTAPEPPPAATLPDVTAGFSGSAWLPATTPIELRLSAPLPPAAGRLVVMIGATDLTGLFARTEHALTYDAGALPLPAGESEVVVHLVAPDGSVQELGRFPIRVLTPRGFERAELQPKLDVSSDGQVAEGHSPAELRPDRPTYQDVSTAAGLATTHARGGRTVRTQANVLGASNRQRALRFGDLQDRAPKLDLADYLVVVERGATTFSVGHVSFGTSRHLANGFGSRGLRGVLPLGGRTSFSVAAMNGSSVVGWDNLLGLERRRHRVLGATLGVEALPARPGALRVETTVLDGSLLPRSSFTQGAVTDAERSRGLSVGLVASDAAQRVRLGAGYAWSRFTNPLDPTLAQGEALVPVRATTRGARYVDVGLSLLPSLRVTAATTATLALAYRHERVDPLFRSVAAYTQADLASHAIDVNGTLGPLATVVTHQWTRDNLDDVASVLTAHTRNTSVRIAAPLGLMMPAKGAWWPTLNVSLARTHQFGAGLPVGGDFAETHVPDQVSLVRSAELAWQDARWRLSYTRNHATQDNRQPGRERSDFATTAHGVSVMLTPVASLQVGVDGSLERAESVELERTDRTGRIGVALDWRPWQRTGFSARLSTTSSADRPRTGERSDTEMRLELTQGVELMRRLASGLPAQLLVRYARHRARSSLLGPAMRETRATWTLNTGLSLRTF